MWQNGAHLFRPGELLSAAAEPAGIWRRFGALLYDGLLLLAIWFISIAALLPIASPVPPWLAQIVVISETAIFYIYFWHKQGQTLGMRAWRLRLVTEAGQHVGWRHIGIRCLVGPFALACLGLGYLWIYVGSRRQAWHDRASSTYVVCLPKDSDS